MEGGGERQQFGRLNSEDMVNMARLKTPLQTKKMSALRYGFKRFEFNGYEYVRSGTDFRRGKKVSYTPKKLILRSGRKKMRRRAGASRSVQQGKTRKVRLSGKRGLRRTR